MCHNYLQTHPKSKSWGCFGKFRIFATLWALRFSKLKKKWLRKWSLKLPTPSPKSGKILCSQFTLIDPLSHSLGHYGLWTWHIRPRIQNYLYFSFYQCVEQILLSLQVMKMQRIIKGVHNVSTPLIRRSPRFCVWLGRTFSVTQRSTVMRNIRKTQHFIPQDWCFETSRNIQRKKNDQVKYDVQCDLM